MDTSTLGEKEITLDFGLYRDVYTIQVIAGEIPVVSGIEDGKVYCGAQEVTITDADNNLASVTLDGEAVALVDGKFTVSAKEGQQTIAATDELGNVTTVKITVNAAHSYTNYESVGDDLETAECDNGCGNTDFRVVEP